MDLSADQRLAVLELERTHLATFALHDLRFHTTGTGFVLQFTTDGTTTDGAELHIPVCLVAEVGDDGRITRVDEYADSATGEALTSSNLRRLTMTEVTDRGTFTQAAPGTKARERADQRIDELGLVRNVAELERLGYTVVENAAPMELFDEIRAAIIEVTEEHRARVASSRSTSARTPPWCTGCSPARKSSPGRCSPRSSRRSSPTCWARVTSRRSRPGASSARAR